MKDLLEPLIYPHNMLLYGLLFACIAYRKKGLWCLLLFYYLIGNTFVANQVRQWYQQQAVVSASSVLGRTPDLFVMLGCGGSAEQIPACAAARIQQLNSEIALLPQAAPLAVVITTRYCEPYLAALQQTVRHGAIDCFDAGENTYQEFQALAKRLNPQHAIRFITSDFHSWRVRQLIKEYQLSASVGVVRSQTFRPVNCTLNCLLTVNLSNLDLYSKLMAEFASYAVYRVAGKEVTGVVSD
ncbi:YdcF family protein [Alishewanella sp. HL-SH06]|uniref:YdcF family protein n=1 Tax=Alishewanella sp. HL-SH06 TaxID=3461144 RepID=UPI0040420EA8